MEIEIGAGKTARRAYGFDDVAIVPSRRTRDPDDVDISWEIDAYRFELPVVASAMDGVVSPATAMLIGRRIGEIKAGGVVAAASLTPQRTRSFADLVLQAELDILVIQGTVVSAEHVSTRSEPLNLKEFIARFDIPVIVGGTASFSTALHLMRTGAAGILVGVGPGAACTTRGVIGVGVPQATAIADASAARMQHLHETGRYCHVIADGGMRTGAT